MANSAVLLGSGLCCVSGTALGAAFSLLTQQVAGRSPRPEAKSRRRRDRDQPQNGEWSDDDFCQPCEPPSPPSPTKRGNNKSRRMSTGGDTNGDIELPTNVRRGSFVDVEPGQMGFSMEEAKEHAATGAAKSKELTPSEVLEELQRGNSRFWTGSASRPEKNAFERRSLIAVQYPKVAVLGCSDSRVPVEIVFDQGLGDIFVVRVAGNCLDNTTIASLQYAVVHLKVKVIVVLGHEGCGACKAARLPIEKIQQEPTELANALYGLKQGLDNDRLSNISDARALDREAAVTNVRRQVEKLGLNKCIMSKVGSDELILVGAFYEISSGIVDFVMEVTEREKEDTHKDKGSVILTSSRRGVSSRLEVASPFAPVTGPNGKSKVEQTPRGISKGSSTPQE